MSPKFSLLSLVLLIATVALALRDFQLTIDNRKFEQNNRRLSLSVGDFDTPDAKKFYIRQLYCMVRLSTMVHVDRLKVENLGLSDAGFAFLANMPSLWQLQIDGNPISDATISQLSNANGLRQLSLARDSTF